MWKNEEECVKHTCYEGIKIEEDLDWTEVPGGRIYRSITYTQAGRIATAMVFVPMLTNEDIQYRLALLQRGG